MYHKIIQSKLCKTLSVFYLTERSLHEPLCWDLFSAKFTSMCCFTIWQPKHKMYAVFNDKNQTNKLQIYKGYTCS